MFCKSTSKVHLNMKKFPFTLICVGLIWILCFCNPPSTKLDNISYIDKFYHIIMYAGTMSIFWLEYWFSHSTTKQWSRKKLHLWALGAPILMSGVIELLQAYCTGGRRSGEWLDFIANTLGVILAWQLGRFVIKKWFKRKN